ARARTAAPGLPGRERARLAPAAAPAPGSRGGLRYHAGQVFDGGLRLAPPHGCTAGRMGARRDRGTVGRPDSGADLSGNHAAEIAVAPDAGDRGRGSGVSREDRAPGQPRLQTILSHSPDGQRRSGEWPTRRRSPCPSTRIGSEAASAWPTGALTGGHILDGG